MVSFSYAMAMLSSSFSTTAVCLESAGRSLDLVAALAISTVIPVFYRKQIASLAENGQLFAAFMDHLPAYAWIKNIDGRYVYINQLVKTLSPFQNDCLGKTDAELWPELAAGYRENDLVVINTRKTVENVESVVVNGEQRCVLVSRFPIFDERGEIIMVGGTSIDITEHKHVEEALRESERFRRMIIESDPECVKLVAPDYTLLDMNPAGLEMIGATSREQVVGQSVLNLVAPECRNTFIGMHQRVCQGESTVSEFKIVGLKGAHRWVESHTVPLVDKESRVVAQLAITRDVTERKRAEDRIRQSEQQLAEAQRVAHIGSWSWDLNCDARVWSDELYRIYGLQPGTIAPTYEAFLALVHAEDRMRLKEVVEHSVKTREPISIYFRIIRPGGEERIIHSRGCILYDDQGAPIRRYGTAQDVTEHWRAQEALRETEEKYRSIFENAVEGIFQTTPEGRFISANPALARMLGFDSPEELINTRTDIAAEHYVDSKSREEFKRSMDENGFARDFELEAYRKDGSKIWVSENVRAVRDQTGTVIYYEGTTQDITGRKRAEEALRESEERYRDLVENSLDLICTHDLDGLVLSANHAAMEIMGYGSESYQGGTNLRKILSPEMRDQLDEYLKRIQADGVASGMMSVLTKTGEKRIWEYHNTLRTQGVATPIVRGMARDITERRRDNHSLRLFRTLIDRSSDAIAVIDPETLRFLDCNKSAYQDLGYSREEFLTLSVYDIDPLVDESMAARLIQEMARSSFVIFESVHRRKDGSTFPVEVNLKSVRLEREYRVAVVRDITERKLAEDALLQAEQKYRRIFENASEGIFQLTPEGKFTAANPALALMYGFESPEEMIRSCNLSQDTYVDPSRHEEFRNLIEQHGAVRDFEYQALQKGGGKIWISLNARALREGQDTISYYEGTAQDITHRKQSEDDLRRQKEVLQKIVDHIPVMIKFTGSDGRIKLVNREWEQTMGWTLEEILKDDFDVFAKCYPDPQSQQQVLDFISTASGQWGDFKKQTRDGSVIDTSWARVKLSDGTTIGIGQNVTARRRAEQALRQAEQKYRELFENAKDAIYVHDLSGRYTSINRAAEKLSGYAREEILGNNFTGFIAPEYVEYVHQHLCQKLRQEGETTYEVEVITKDGRRVPVEVSSRLIYEEGVPVAVQGTARNIAERKRAEEALRGYSRQLIRAQEAERESIARGLHDQIGQVLTAIRINLQTIRASADRAQANVLVDEGVTIVDEAIQQVRDLSFELRPSLLDDLGLTAALRWYADRYTQRTGIQTQTSICPESRTRLPRELETACYRIVQEALTNVARHAQAKSVSVDVRTINGALSLSIKDDGIGFKLPSQKDGELLNSLGLRGMEERAHGAGGNLVIKSAPHQGTEVRVFFPNGSKRKEST